MIEYKGITLNKIQSSQATTKKSLSRILANKAEEEMMKTGTVTVRCPECDEHPVVDRNSHRVYVQCPCGFVRKAELLEI